MMRRTRPRSRAAPTGVATGIPNRGRAAEATERTRGAVGLEGDPPRAGRGARRSPRTGEPGLAQVHARPRTREEARPRAPSAAGGRLPLASASRPSPRFPLPHTHTRAARLTPHVTAASARSTRADADPAPSGTQLPGAAPTTARPRTAHACTRRLYPTRRRLRFRSGHSQPRTLQVPAGSARARRRGGLRNRASS